MKIFHRILLVLLVCSSNVFAINQPQTTVGCPAFPYFKPSSGPLALVNCDFHKSYEQQVAQQIRTFGAPGGRPVILNLGGTLMLKYNGRTEVADINPSAYHNIKVFDHAAFAVFLTLTQQKPGRLNAKTIAFLRSLNKDLKQATAAIPTLDLTPNARTLSEKLAITTADFINKILKNGSWSNIELHVYYAEINHLLLESFKLAGHIELKALDDAVNKWLSKMSPQDKKQLAIVVATSHQARDDEISLQYFAKRFGYQFGVGAQHEHGFVVLEGKFDEGSALALLARHYIDRQAAQMILGDPELLQRDLLADSFSSSSH